MADPLISRGQTHSTVGVDVATLSITMQIGDDSTIANVPAAAFALAGGLDGATVRVDRVFAANWSAPVTGNLNVFIGNVADVEVTGTSIEIEAKSELEKLNQVLPKNVYQAGCIHTLYGPGCGLVAANFTVTGNTAANSTRYSIVSNLSNPTGYFDLGVIEFTSGPMDGVSRTVKSYANGVVVPSFPFPAAPSPGDLFGIRPGCDKRFATCNGSTLNNAANFRGYEFIPVPETSY